MLWELEVEVGHEPAGRGVEIRYIRRRNVEGMDGVREKESRAN